MGTGKCRWIDYLENSYRGIELHAALDGTTLLGKAAIYQEQCPNISESQN